MSKTWTGERYRMMERVAVENLREIKEILDNVGIEFWLDHGTLLGAVREGKIIEWDSDIDLGTWYDNAEEIISVFPEFKRRGFSAILIKKNGIVHTKRRGYYIGINLYRKRGRYAWSVPTIYLKKMKRIEEIFFWGMNVLSLITYIRPDGKFIRRSEPFSGLLPLKLKQLLIDILWAILDRRGCIIPLIIPKHYFEKLSNTKFYNMEFNIPLDVRNYLKYRYGSDWKKPVKEWKYEDDGALNRKIRLCDFDFSTMHANKTTS